MTFAARARACRPLSLSALLSSLFIVVLAAPAASQPQPGLAAGIFEIDGNLVSSDPSRIDWFGGGFGSPAGVIDPDSCAGSVMHLLDFPDAAFYRDDHWTGSESDTSFAGSRNKNNDCIDVDPWVIGSGSGPAKNDITESYSASYIDPATGENWLLLAFATRATNGASEIDFEFNAAGLNLDPATSQISGNGPDCGRTVGDFIVSINFVSGGSTPQPEVRRWDGTAYVPIDTTPAPGEPPHFLIAVNDGSVSAPCGAISPDGIVVPEYEALQFAEIAVNLTGVGVDLSDFCGKPRSTLSFKTRASDSFTAELKDVKLFPFQLVPSTACVITGDLEICQDGVTELCGPATDAAGNPLDYAWSNGATSQCVSFAGTDLGPGAHTIALVISNAFGCVDSCEVTLTVHPSLDVSATSAVACAGEAGTLTASVANGSGPYLYSWSSGETTASISPTEAGEYCVTVTDANGCQGQACATLTVHAPVEVSIADAEACAGDAGTLSASIQSGTGPYTYVWSSGETSASITPTESGEYCVTVTDANGCQGQACATFTVHAAVVVSVADAQACAGDAGTLSASVSGGTGPYTYVWSSGETSASISPTESGEYCVTITDANGCQGQACATLTLHAPVVVTVADAEACAGEAATLSARVASGAGPYTYLWSTGEAAESISPTEPGEYCVAVTDANGCVGEACATLSVHPLLDVSVNDSQTCAGEAATLSASLANGTEPFTYSWSTGETSESIAVSVAGEYCVTVTDANGCEGQACGTLSSHPTLDVSMQSIEVCEGGTASFNCAISNGSAPFTFSWNTGETSETISASEAGEYCVTVIDANGCEGQACATLGVNPALDVTMADVEVCAGDTATLTCTVSNGTGPFTYSWNSGETSETIAPTESGEYCVTVTDAKGCEGTACATFSIRPALDVSMDDVATCAGEVGTLRSSVSNGTGPYTFSWNTGETSEAISPAESGEYCVTVTDANGCEGQACATLTVYAGLVVAVDDAQTCDGESGVLSASVANGTAPYTYAWDTGETSASIVPTQPGDYSVTVTDANGCQGEATGTLAHESSPTCLIDGPQVLCAGDLETFIYSAGSPIVAAAKGAVAPSRNGGFGLRNAAAPTVAKSGAATPGVSAGAFSWAVDDPRAEILGPSDAAQVEVRFNGTGMFTISLEMTSGIGCSNSCQFRVHVLDCSGANCPRTVGFWGRQCEQSGNGDTKFSRSEMEEIVRWADARSEAFDFGTGDDAFAAFCEIINTDEMDQRHQAKRQFAGMLANVGVTNLGFVAANGDTVRLLEFTEIDCNFEATTIAELISEIDSILVALEHEDLDEPAVKWTYASIIRCTDDINNANGIGPVCGDVVRDDKEALPEEPPAALFKPSPNPSRGRTSVAYAVAGAQAQPVLISVYDIAGRRVRVLERGLKSAGRHSATWDGRNGQGIEVARGVYFIRGVIAGQAFSSRIVLVR
ncbi:MAG: hypothetical protein JSW67_11205 [Candidatus Latescibacterota bacterium]|nr:MAG: hypothetical protein JSW67_11205 [Candidatus Latescibacterota bacterium]